MDNQKKVRKFIPCSLYCTEKIAKWLEDMAAEGYVLYTFSKFDYAVFYKGEPKKTRYRLWLRNDNKLEEEAKEIRQKYGWRRIDDVRCLEIYCSDGNEIPGIDTDEKALELQDKAIKYQLRQNIISLCLLLFPTIIYCLFKEFGSSAVNFGIGALLLPILMLLFVIAKHTAEIIDIKTYKKHTEDKNAYIKNTSKINLFLYATKYISLIVLLVTFIPFLHSADTVKDVWYSNSDSNETFPFVTIEDFIPDDAVRKSETKGDSSAIYQKWSNVVSPVNYYWCENDIITLPDGTNTEISLRITYHETKSPILARWVASDYYLEDKSFKINSKVHKLSDFGIDYGLYYHTPIANVVIAQKGNKLIMAEFLSLEFYSVEETIEIICNCLM